jgi:hypothetical protein
MSAIRELLKATHPQYDDADWQRLVEAAFKEARNPDTQATTRFTLAQALIGSELIARLLEYSGTNDDPRQLAQSWAHRIADWLDQAAAPPSKEVLP